MRIEIQVSLEEKLLKQAKELNMSPTQFVNFLIENIDIELPRIEKVTVQVQPMRIEGGNKIREKLRTGGFVKNW